MIKTEYTAAMNQGQSDALYNALQAAVQAASWAAIITDSRKPKITEDMPYDKFIDMCDKNAALVKKINAAVRAMEKLQGQILNAESAAE